MKGVADTEGVSYISNGGSVATLTDQIEDTNVETIELTTIDTIAKDGRVFAIVMDIEGSELLALKGARETIIRDHPVLAIRVYHRADDLITIPQFIQSIAKENYKMYLRVNSIDFGAYDITLYAV